MLVKYQLTRTRVPSQPYYGTVQLKKHYWISELIYYIPHYVFEYPGSTRVLENFWIFTRRILHKLDIYPRGSRVLPGLSTPKSG